MKQAVQKARKAVADPRNRIALWAVAVVFVLGFLEPLVPLDDAMRTVRNHIRSKPASGEIALVVVDAKSSAAVGEWPWPRDRIATLVDKLNERGVRRIAFDYPFVDTGRPADDARLADAFARSATKPMVAAKFEMALDTGERQLSMPSPRLAKHTETVGSSLYFNGFGHAWSTPYAFVNGTSVIPSLSSALAGKAGPPDGKIQIDYAIDPKTVPAVSALSVLNGDVGAALRGKDVVVGSGTVVMPFPGEVPRPRLYAHVLAAETLKLGTPLHLGWLPPFAVAVLLGGIVWFGRRSFAAIALGAGFVFAVALPLYLEGALVTVEPASALVLLAFLASVRAWRSYRRGDARINALTGLPNMLAFRERQLSPGEAIVAVRIKNYSEVVAALSQNEDALAAQIVARMSPGGGISIYQGDEGIFAWVAPAAMHDKLTDQLDALHNFFLQPISVGSWQVDVAIAFGVEASAGTDISGRFASALVAADEAAQSGMRWKYYDPKRLDEAEWKMSLLGRLDTAIGNGEVWVAYQPKLNLAGNEVVGMEALVRWSHPQRGAISPEEFVSVAESQGRIDKLTYFVLDEALKTVVATGGRFGVAVNLSARMFERREFVSRVAEAIAAHKVPAHLLTMEITESAAVESEASMLSTVDALVKLGVKVSIDDYGTGYCTLEYLKKVQATELKIDRGFVNAIDHSRSDRLLVNATIELAHSLGHTVVAEGVETEAALKVLEAMGCDIAQGYYIARPMPFADLVDFLGKPFMRQAA